MFASSSKRPVRPASKPFAVPTPGLELNVRCHDVCLDGRVTGGMHGVVTVSACAMYDQDAACTNENEMRTNENEMHTALVQRYPVKA